MIDYENLGKLNAKFDAELRQAFSEVMDSGYFVLGKKVEAFEKRFSSFVGTSHAIGVASGLDALLLSLKALELPIGSEVIVPSNTYIATILAVMQAGLEPVLVEPDARTYNIDPTKIEERITARTSAVLVVHMYGRSCRMDRIGEICRRRGLRLVEDCAQSHGALFQGRMTGSFGDLAGFSFYPTKNLGCLGDGGAVLTSDDELAVRIKTLRNYGSKVKYYNELIGYNSRLDELQAAFLLAKLDRLDTVIRHKRELSEIYFSGLKSDFILPAREADCFDVFHIFNIRHEARDRLREYLLQEGVRTEVHYPVPPHQQQALRDRFVGHRYPISEEIHRTTLSLPISYIHTPEEIERVVSVMNRF